jgi:hypothetical protein
MSLESEQTALNTSEKAVLQNVTQTTLGSVRQKLQDPKLLQMFLIRCLGHH